MNLLLLRPEELGAADEVRLAPGRRLTHLIDVLGARPGDTLRCGVLDGPVGTAEVLALDAGTGARLRCTLATTPPPRPDDMLLLAVPRPRVLRRCLVAAASLGFGQVVLLRTWRVDRSHLESQHVAADAVEQALLEGLEQGCRTHVPRWRVAPLFRPFVEDELAALATPHALRVVGHPAPAACPVIELPRADGPFALAIGPERGFTDHEVAALAAVDFVAVRAGEAPLKVETALAVLAGQLQLLRAGA